MAVLVTGASGFVGAAVARHLIDAGQSVRLLVRPNSDRRNVAGLAAEVVTGDLHKPETLRPAVDGCDGLYHVAADYRLWVRDPQAMFAANVDGTRALMTAALDAGVKRIVYTSSVATLGLLPDSLADETTPSSFEQMIGPYKQSKFLAEQEVCRLVTEQRLPAVIVNPSTPIGPRDVKPTPTGRIIVDAAAGRMPAYVDTGLNVVHVDDVAQGHLLAFEHGTVGERYILGGHNLTLREILNIVAQRCGRRPPSITIPHGAVLPFAALAEMWCRLAGGEPFATIDGVKMARKKMFFSSARAEKSLGYRYRPAEEAIADALAWFRQSTA